MKAQKVFCKLNSDSNQRKKEAQNFFEIAIAIIAFKEVEQYFQRDGNSCKNCNKEAQKYCFPQMRIEESVSAHPTLIQNSSHSINQVAGSYFFLFL